MGFVYSCATHGLAEREMSRIDNDLIDPAVEPAGEKAHRVARIVLGALPVLGGAGVEIFNSIIDTPMNERKQRWMVAVGDALNELLDAKVLTEEGLQQNEAFITTVAQASILAIRNHQQEKLDALRNAALNVAAGHCPEDDLRQMFLNFVDSCTVTHIRLLSLMDGPAEWAELHGVQYPNWTMAGLSNVIEHALPELRGKESLYGVIWRDLYQQGFVNSDELRGTLPPAGLMVRRTTDIGRQLIAFLSEPAGLK